jgi:O-Antigen ligase
VSSRISELVSVRGALILAAAIMAVLGASGLVEAHAFLLPTPLKYGLTVAGPLVLFFIASIERPLLATAALLVVAAPFANATAEFAGIRMSPLLPLLVLGALLVVISDRPSRRSPTLGWAGILAFPLLLIPLADGKGDHQFIFSLATLIGVAWLVSRAIDDERSGRLILTAVAAQTALQGAIAIWEFHTGHPLNLYSSASSLPQTLTYGYGSAKQPIGTLNDPISLANTLAMAVPQFAVLLLIVARRTHRAVIGVGLAAVAIALGLALDRTSWIAAVVGTGVTIALLPKPTRRRAFPIAAGLLAAVVIVMVIAEGSAVTSRFSSIFDPTSTQGKSAQDIGTAAGESNRLQLWSTALRHGFLDHPIAGIGIDDMNQLEREYTATSGLAVKDGTAQYQDAASVYFQVLGDAGTFALVLFLIFFGGLISDIKAALRGYPLLAAGAAGAVLAMLMCWFNDVVLFNEPVAACAGVLIGTTAGLAAAARTREPNAPTRLRSETNDPLPRRRLLRILGRPS